MKTTEEKVKKVLTKISGVRHIEPTASLTADLGLDSLRRTDLVLHLEDAFGIEFRQSDMNFFKLKDVAAVVTLVEGYIGTQI